ncbi:MAG: Crp/Fnr family transcriptional regulator [Verrucomicrobiia bacterium]
MKDLFGELKTAAIVATLRHCRLFTGLGKDDIEKIAGITVIKTFEKGDYVFRQNEPSHGFYIVQKGAINVHRVNKFGREQVIHIFRDGESFAEASLTMETGYPADARAEESSQLLLVQKSGFMNLLRSQPELAIRMFVAMSLHLRSLVEQLEEVSLKTVEGRLANWLLKRLPSNVSNEPVIIQLEVPKRVLAAELGTVSETLSRSFAKFKTLGIINVKGKQITILSSPELRKFVKSDADID